MKYWRIALILPILHVAACSMSTLEEPAELVDFKQQAEFDEAWDYSLSDDGEDLLLGLRPATDGTRIYAADYSGRIVALDVESGRLAWEFDTQDQDIFEGGLPLSAGPGVGEGHVAVGSANGDIVVLDADDGSLVWQNQVNAELLAAPVIESGKVLFRTGDGRLLTFSLANGNPQWDTVREMPLLSLRGQSQPAVEDGNVFVAWDSGKVASIAMVNGALNWETSIGTPTGASEVQQLADIDGDVVVFGAEVYVAGHNTNVAALAIESGEMLWREELSTVRGPAVSYSSVVVADIDSVLHGFDRLTGTSLWTQDVIRARSITAPEIWNDFAVVGDFEGYLHFFDRATGEMMARIEHDGDPVQARPLAVGDLLVVMSADGDLAAYRQVGQDDNAQD